VPDINYQICTRCVMDTSDPEIGFNEQGVCNHCRQFDEVTSRRWFPNAIGKKKLDAIFTKIRAEGKNKKYDCIIGLSGGVDSSYLAVIMKDSGLRPLVVHVDAGWNSELAVYNIEQVVKYCDYDLHTHVMDWEEIRDLQLSYLKAGLANQDVVQDHAYFASLYHFAAKNNIKYVISGGNIATESVFPGAWHHAAMDAINLKAIHNKFGKVKLKHYKTVSFLTYYFYYPFVKGMTIIRPLNFMPYDTGDAVKLLTEKIGYKEYGRKHGESRFTKFFQNYYLPEKFTIDKRRPHLASQVLSAGLTRGAALAELQKPLYRAEELIEDKAYIAKKLGLSSSDMDILIEAPAHDYSEYKNWDNRYKLMRSIRTLVEKLLGRNVKAYS
jgi:aminotransferase